jgi:anti-sigma factor RsiW
MANEEKRRYLWERYLMIFGKNDGKTEHLWVEERLSPYLDGELSSQEQDAVEHHLARCQDCRWNLRTLRQTVGLTNELPTVPVPRVFTIPAPAQKPIRARQRRWGLGLLQGATALVALLLVFAVAGDFVLTGMMPGRSAAPIVMKEQAVVDSAATEEAEEAPPQAMRAASAPATVSESGAAEKSAAAANVEPSAPPEPTPAPESTAAPMMQAAPSEPTASAEPEASALGATQFESPIPATGEAAGGGAPTEAPQVAAAAAPGQTEATEPAAAEQVTTSIPEAATGQADATAATEEPARAMAPEPLGEEPTVVAAAPAVAPQAEQERATEREEVQASERDSLLTWVQTAEIVLGAAFVLMAGATIGVMIRRRRAR